MACRQTDCDLTAPPHPFARRKDTMTTKPTPQAKATPKTPAKKATIAKRKAPATTKALQDKIIQHLRGTQGTYEEKATPQAWWRATACAVNEYVMAGLTDTQKTHSRFDTRAVNYLSMEDRKSTRLNSS